ncbi:MAG: thioredoxin family protein [Rhodospirillaceae bacterium]|nr:thioredoxin family protein [Rhodospirillales bacterium]
MERLVLKIVVAVLVLFGAKAWASEGGAGEGGASDWVTNDTGKIRLIAATTALGDARSVKLGLHFQLAPGWKIYWRTPGDAGYPPKMNWTGSVNLGPPNVSWPAPKRFQLAGLQNHGYTGEVVLPLDAPVTQPGQAAQAMVAVDYLACAQICVPQEAKLILDLPAGPAQPSAFVHDISRFTALVPGDGARHGVSVDKLEAVGSGDQSFLRLTISASEPLIHPDMFIEPADVASFEAPRVALSKDGRRATLESPVVQGTVQRALAEGPLTITLADGSRSLEATLTPVIGTGAAMAEPAPTDALAGMLLVALLGGLILNLMPCVLPVLSIKVLGALSHGGAERGHVRAAFLASATGIVASFLALAGAAVMVKSAGQAVGWGIQFQQPMFLAVMITLLLLFAVNLWGWFEIRLPAAFMSVGSGGIAHHTLLGHFLSGAFATLLATPCSAPFLGTAVGFALARGPGEIMAIFAALGMGMALPYLAMAAWPDLARRLPKPGAWMVTVRKIMAAALAATALWLGSILATQTGLLGVATQGTKTDIAWTAFDQTALAQAVAGGTVVFVDVTADWCITCKVNKAAVVERGEIAKRLTTGAVLPMRADWTKPDDGIARYLASFNRYGIPFNAVYGPGAPDGIALSELLSEAEVLAALDKAAGDKAAAR